MSWELQTNVLAGLRLRSCMDGWLHRTSLYLRIICRNDMGKAIDYVMPSSYR